MINADLNFFIFIPIHLLMPKANATCYFFRHGSEKIWLDNYEGTFETIRDSGFGIRGSGFGIRDEEVGSKGVRGRIKRGKSFM